jgi:hypothetical protein
VLSLATPEVDGWAETKYRLLALYDELFSAGMNLGGHLKTGH